MFWFFGRFCLCSSDYPRCCNNTSAYFLFLCCHLLWNLRESFLIVLKRKFYSDGLVFTPPFQPRCSFPYHYLEIVPSCAFITFTLYASTNIATVRISTRSSKLFIRPLLPRLSQTSTSTTSLNLTIGFEAQDFSKCFDLPPVRSLNSISKVNVEKARPFQCKRTYLATLSHGRTITCHQHPRKLTISSNFCFAVTRAPLPSPYNFWPFFRYIFWLNIQWSS